MGDVARMLDTLEGRKASDNLNRNSFQSALSGEASKLYNSATTVTPFMLNVSFGADPTTPWSEYPHQRDKELAKLARDETIFSGASYSMRTRMASLFSRDSLVINGDEHLVDLAYEILDSAEGGKGHGAVIDKMMAAYDTQDNGWFVELVGAGDPNGQLVGRPTTFNFLDPSTCYRTFDPEYPVFYRDPLTFTFHRLHKSRVIFGGSAPSISATARGVGECTLTRALRIVRILKNISVYKDEKISGRFTRAIGYGKGITNDQLNTITGATGELADSLGLSMVGGIPFFTTVMGVELGLLDLASLPDGFDTQNDTTINVYALALAFGIDAREIWPATASGATKADATIQHMKAQGKGIADRIGQVRWMLKNGPLRDLDVDVDVDFKDDDQDLRRAQIHETRTRTLDLMVKNGTLSPRQSLAVAVSEGILDKETLENIDEIVADIEAADMPEEPQPIPPPSPFGMTQPGDNTDVQLQQETPPPAPPLGDVTAKKKAVAWEQSRKQLQSIRLEFEGDLESLIIDARAGTVDKRRFSTILRALINRYGRDAYDEGLKKGGVEGGPDDEELGVIAHMVSDQTAYVATLADAIYDGSGLTDAEAAAKAAMWWNKSIMPFYMEGLASADKNGMYEWVIGSTKEHCDDCNRLNGQVHRLKDWTRKGWQPQSDQLACKGFNCKCTLVKTTGKAQGSF